MEQPQLPHASSPSSGPILSSNVVCLALQGGGSLGAYTWGVLDALLEDGRLELQGVTGSSAGAINAAVLGIGYTIGGPTGAREGLAAFWEALAQAAHANRRGRLGFLRGLARLLPRPRSADALYALTTHLVSDFLITWDTMEPLRGTLARSLDFSVLRRPDALKVFVTATDVQTAHPRTFVGGAINENVICASCAVPFLFKPVRIGEGWYWDGGLVANPTLYPVIHNCTAHDIVLVETIATRAETIPDSATAVLTRSLQLASMVGVVREMRTIQLVSRLLQDHPPSRMRDIRVHRIPAHPGLASIEGKRSFRADLPYFRRLRKLGREAGEEWIAGVLDRGVAAPRAAPLAREIPAEQPAVYTPAAETGPSPMTAPSR